MLKRNINFSPGTSAPDTNNTNKAGSRRKPPKEDTQTANKAAEIDAAIKRHAKAAVDAQLASIREQVGQAAADALRHDEDFVASMTAKLENNFQQIADGLAALPLDKRQALIDGLQDGTTIDVDGVQGLVEELMDDLVNVRITQARKDLEVTIGAFDLKLHPGVGATSFLREVKEDVIWFYTRPILSWKRVSLTFLVSFTAVNIICHTWLANYTWAQHWAVRYGVPLAVTAANEFIAFLVRRSVFEDRILEAKAEKDAKKADEKTESAS